ncbi:CLUMA_CG014164, isoform A [Clunio marinus]|uniref:CLUMA_CG014164, isoform A n=1 Tax=Clunio marinus TaxID=568069 RepID=A0A1J1IL73_9DIPT|nr:CLUMA_CG014164, isoform A [Clunio marinus]
MTNSPLTSYIKCSRIVFNVQPSEVWINYNEFEDSLRELYSSILCNACREILKNPVIPKKHHFSCQHRVCLDCIGKKRASQINCKMCSDYTLFEKSNSTNLLLKCFQELCEIVQGSWIYEYVKKQAHHDTGQSDKTSLIEIIDAGMNYGRVSIVLDDTSSDENSNSSDSNKDPTTTLRSTPYASQIFPNISPLSPVKPGIVQSPEPFTIISEPVIPMPAPLTVIPASSPPLPQIVQFHPQIVQPQVPSTSKFPPNHQQISPSFVKYPPPSPMRINPIAPAIPLGSTTGKPIMSTMKMQSTFASSSPTIYSVMYTGSGNKITLKRKPPEDVVTPVNTNNLTILKTENNTLSSNFKRPPVQISSQQTLQTQSNTAPITSANVITTIPSTTSSNSNLNNDPTKRRGCRCGNATAAPGKLTCCGQRCPCYVDSKACIDCKCKGCRNPHYVDGHKKMRHHVPDVKTQQQQQQHFLASIQQQTTIVKDIHKSAIPSTSVIKHEDFSHLDQQPTIISKGQQSSINSCIISNNNGQYQIKQNHPRILVKEPSLKTMSPLIFPTSSAILPVVTSVSNSNLQIVGVYSQSDKKIVIKSEQQQQQPQAISFADTTKQIFESNTIYAGNLNTNLL